MDVFEGRMDGQIDWWDTLSDEERGNIKKGLREANRGEIISHEEVMNKYKKWM